MKKFCIIGAGITGITISKKLEDSVILEKSRGIGGRLAARRLGSYSLNHGPAELRGMPGSHTIKNPHSWIEHEAEKLTITRSWEVSHLELLSDRIKVISTLGQVFESLKIILTIPAPQAQLILNRSGLPAHFLTPVRYKKVIQFMFLASSTINVKGLDDIAVVKKLESLNEKLIMGLYELKEEFIEEFFEEDKEVIKKIFLVKIFGGVLDCHVHKWRYSEIISSISPELQTTFKDKNIYLAGDYFGSLGVNSSLESINNLLPFL